MLDTLDSDDWAHVPRFANRLLCDLGKFLVSGIQFSFCETGLHLPAMSEEHKKLF